MNNRARSVSSTPLETVTTKFRNRDGTRDTAGSLFRSCGIRFLAVRRSGRRFRSGPFPATHNFRPHEWQRLAGRNAQAACARRYPDAQSVSSGPNPPVQSGSVRPCPFGSRRRTSSSRARRSRSAPLPRALRRIGQSTRWFSRGSGLLRFAPSSPDQAKRATTLPAPF